MGASHRRAREFWPREERLSLPEKKEPGIVVNRVTGPERKAYIQLRRDRGNLHDDPFKIRRNREVTRVAVIQIAGCRRSRPDRSAGSPAAECSANETSRHNRWVAPSPAKAMCLVMECGCSCSRKPYAWTHCWASLKAEKPRRKPTSARSTPGMPPPRPASGFPRRFARRQYRPQRWCVPGKHETA